ncbi:MAG: hypothetical protein HQ483_03355 [Rhodospirillales bacterium]|nr:hypothetical protein [Rhodospirillales bacterium]
MNLRSLYIKPSESPIPSHLRGIEYWEKQRADRIAPRWSDISLLDFDPAIIPFINVMDIDPRDNIARYRFWGTGLTETFDRDYTNAEVQQLAHSGVKNAALAGLEKAIEEKQPNCEVREFLRSTGLVGRQIILRLPLSDDGDTINRTVNLCYHEMGRANQSTAMFFEKVLAREG